MINTTSISWTLMLMLVLLGSSFVLMCIGVLVAVVGIFNESRREKRIRVITRQYHTGKISQGEYRRQMQMYMENDNRWG